VDVRVLAATNVDLLERIRLGQFRQDLYYRLNVIAIELPPLRGRGDDVLLLANHYLQKFARSMGREAKHLSSDAVHALRSYDWPGNVRELEHAIEHAMVLAQRDVIAASDLPFGRHSTLPAGAAKSGAAPPAADNAGGEQRSQPWSSDWSEYPYAEAKKRLLARFDAEYTSGLLKISGGNMSEAARRAGLDRSNFRRLLKRRRDEG
jgi:DNA-binding NtrC family response regulator